jgi:hypothetical protein
MLLDLAEFVPWKKLGWTALPPPQSQRAPDAVAR